MSVGQSSKMAPEVPTTLAAACDRAMEGQVESQDSQAVMVAMHRLHGIGVRSSSPVDPLEYDQDLIQHMLQQSRPPKVHQQHLGNAHFAVASSTAESSTNNKSSKAKSNAKARRSNKGKTSNPAAAATARNKGSGRGRGLDRPDTAAAATAANLIPSSQARSTDASNDRVSFSHVHSQSPRRLSRHPTPAHFHTDVTSGPRIEQTKLPSQRQTPPNESIASSLSAAASVGSPSSGSTLLLGNDTIKSQHLFPTSQRIARPVLQTYSKKGRRKNMDSSQSPTQSNDERSYEQYLPRGDDLISSDPIRQPRPCQRSFQSSLSPGNTDTPLEDDDTGQVDLDFNAFARRDTQISVADTATTTQPQLTAPDYYFGNPETPAAPRNPFAGTKAAALIGSSQMFKQTQYSSAFKATFSPTSSRPSPDNLHMNSISPNPSPLKRILPGPSPLQGASSLPQFPLDLDTSPQQADDDDAAPPYEDQIARSNVSKSFHLPPQPLIEDYRPIQRWETRAVSAQSGSSVDFDSDEDMSDEEERRRQLVALKKAKAKRRLEAITLERPSDEAIVPASNKEEVSPTVRQYLDQCEGLSRRDSQNSIEDTQDAPQDVADSQDGMVELSATLPGRTLVDEGISSNDVVPNTDPSLTSAPIHTEEVLAVQIPETSPARLRALGDMMPQSSDEASKPGSFSKLLNSPCAGTPPEARPRPVSRLPQQQAKDAVVAGSIDSGVGVTNDEDAPSIVVTSSPPAPAFSTRARLRAGKNPATAPLPSSSISPLSRLTTTPELSDKTTPLTEESPQGGLTPISTSTHEAVSSPAVAKAHRQRSKPVIKPAPSGLRESTRRTARRSFPCNISVSTDELAGSPRPSTPTLEQSTRMSRLGRASIREPPASRNNSRGGAKIFAGMAFAISFQGKQPGEKDVQYKARMTISTSITTKIKQAGGKLLPDGFDHLFEFGPVKNADREASSVSSTPQPDDDITLTPQAQDTGFTALIADGHSRKAKYMQALALGLPCIHERWITACIEQHRLVDWADYLLCAGNSSFLGDAVRSRNLSPYDAASAKLRQVIQYRPRLLDQSRILLLMARADESRKAAYIFLARVLGASLSRVHTVDEARRQLKAREDAGRPFDWVYIVDEKLSVEDLFMPPAAGVVEGSRKRKRRSEVVKGDVSIARPAKRVRALSDELVIQSLILGRLMKEAEMKPVTVD